MARLSNTPGVGDRCAYRVSFLRSTGQYSGQAPFARGSVVASFPSGDHELLTVDWDHGDSYRVLSCNLVQEDRIALEAV